MSNYHPLKPVTEISALNSLTVEYLIDAYLLYFEQLHWYRELTLPALKVLRVQIFRDSAATKCYIT